MWARPPKASHFRGHQCVRLRYGLTACCPRFRVAFRASFNRSVSLTIVALLRGSGFCPGGSVSHWTHLPFLDTQPDVNVSAHPARLIQSEVQATDRALRERILPEYRLSKSAMLDEVPPSLQPHYRTFDTTTRYSVPVPRIGTQAIVGASHLRGSLCIGATGSHVPHQSLDQGHAHLYAGRRLGRKQVPPRLLPEERTAPGFDVVPKVSTLHQWFAFARLL